MTERTIYSGPTPLVFIRSGGDVTIKGYESDRVLAGTVEKLGLELKRKKQSIEVQLGGSGQVLVPFGSSIVVFAGRNAEIQGITGNMRAYAGQDLSIIESNVLEQASAGGKMSVDCNNIATREVRLSAGWNLQCWIRNLKNAKCLIDDIGGKWYAVFGDGRALLWLKAGGDVHLISEEKALIGPPDGSHGEVERPR